MSPIRQTFNVLNNVYDLKKATQRSHYSTVPRKLYDMTFQDGLLEGQEST